MDGTDSVALTRSGRLKAETATVHGRLDARIMAAGAFADRARYVRFLLFQRLLHEDGAPLYGHPALAGLLAGAGVGARLHLVERDLEDLGEPRGRPAGAPEPAFAFGLPDAATALGWLYVLEGARLGGGLLLKGAQGLGLTAAFGARHLAPAPEGVLAHWRRFTAGLDGADLDGAGERAVIAGATAAFQRAHALADFAFG
ncbi:biliverdin-producing heme oxygenase [Xanthobacter oligotrophicus]|uniref:Biliverdin-producing heme oxygenase n=1 Tax=Xanthobacter oligotrophicus TaxID=2607286 RepID=A0ABW7A0W6_9HYPH